MDSGDDVAKTLVNRIETLVILLPDALVKHLLGFVKDCPQPLWGDSKLLNGVGNGFEGGCRLVPPDPGSLKACGHVRNILQCSLHEYRPPLRFEKAHSNLLGATPF